MGIHLWAFIGISALIIITPGPDTVLVTKNAVVYGRRAAVGTSLGVNTGLLIWTCAAACGIAALVRESAVAFTVLKLVGAVYLVWLGAQTLLAARHRAPHDVGKGQAVARETGAWRGFRQGLINDLANPKIAAFFTSPALTRRARGPALEALAGEVSPLLQKFLAVLNQNLSRPFAWSAT